MKRKLASIQTITDIKPIEGAEFIETAKVEGWNVVVKKGEFKVGDRCVYCEIDSLLPEAPEFEFLRPKRFRIKTVRLRGQISQGICFPLYFLEGKKYDTDKRENPTYSFEEGMDVTGLLKVTKYEPPIPANLSGLVKGNFPGFLVKTDEERVQNLGNVLLRHKGKIFYVTEKLDGASMSVYQHSEFGVCSRKLDLKETENNAYWLVARQEKIEEKLKSYGDMISVQGEILGFNIQGNKYKLPLNKFIFRLFNVFNIKTGSFFNYKDMVLFAKDFGFETVPVITESFELKHSIDDLLTIADGNSILYPEGLREGLVFRTLEEERDEDLGRLSFKAISNAFLLKYGE
jgi:RNA ligase (TIGR02306 family)